MMSLRRGSWSRTSVQVVNWAYLDATVNDHYSDLG